VQPGAVIVTTVSHIHHCPVLVQAVLDDVQVAVLAGTDEARCQITCIILIIATNIMGF
jgi:hypothetical protein